MAARSGTKTIPVTMLGCYFEQTRLDQSSSAIAFTGIVNTKSGKCLRKSGGRTCSYTRVQELMMQRLSKLRFDMSSFGMHSF